MTIHTNGLSTRSMIAIGRENMSAKRSENVSASVFGASSPTTMRDERDEERGQR